MKGHPIRLSLYEEVFLEVRKHMPRRELHAAFCRVFERDDVSLDALKQIMLRKGWKTGRTGGFEKGLVPHNKGKPMRPETKAKLAGTWFQKGHRPHTYRGPGHEYVCQRDGTVMLHIADPSKPCGVARVYKHVHLWEQAHGPVPEGHVLKCLDGDPTNCDPSNWEAIPRALLPRLNGGRFKTRLAYAEAEPEVRPALLAIAKLEHAAREAKHRETAE